MGRKPRPGAKGGGGGGGVHTQGDLARVHGVTQQAVSKWIADPRWQAAGFSARGPWTIKDIARQKLWREEVLQEDRTKEAVPVLGAPGAASMGDLQRARMVSQIKYRVAQEQKVQAELRILNRDWIKREEAEEKEAAKWRSVREALCQLPKSLRQSLGDADAAGCEAILDTAIRAVLSDFNRE